MKKVLAMLVPVKTRNTEARESPIKAQNAQNSIWEVAADRDSIFQDRTKMKASGASITTHFSVKGKKLLNPVFKHRNKAGQDQAAAHIVIDAEHMPS